MTEQELPEQPDATEEESVAPPGPHEPIEDPVGEAAEEPAEEIGVPDGEDPPAPVSEEPEEASPTLAEELGEPDPQGFVGGQDGSDGEPEPTGGAMPAEDQETVQAERAVQTLVEELQPEAAEEPAAEEPPAEEPPAEEPSAEEPAAEEPAAAPAAQAPPEQPAELDPYAPPGDWYVIHTYAGYENKVKANLRSRIQTMQMQDKIFDVVVPMEDVIELKGGRKQVVQKKVFPGYLLVKMDYDNDSWYVVRNTPGVTGFVASGTGQKPTPLSRREVEKILGQKKEEAKPTFRLEFEEGDVVRIIAGPFADFNGTIHEINIDQQKVRVMVNIFDRETPVELSFDQVARV